MPPSIHKFIFVFLGLAGGVALVGLLTFSKDEKLLVSSAHRGGNAQTQAATIKSTPAIPIAPPTAAEVAADTTASNNLTKNLARNIIIKIIDFNNASSVTLNGKVALQTPPPSMLADAVHESANAIEPQNIGLTQTIYEGDIMLSDSETPQNYFAAVKAMFEGTDVGAADFSSLGQTASGTQTSPGLLKIAALKTALQSLPAPKPLAEFHKALLLTVTHLGEIGTSMNDYQPDPLKTIVVMQGAQAVLSADAAHLKTALAKAGGKTVGGANTNTSPLVSVWRSLFGIDQASAQAFVPVRDFEAERLLQLILNKTTDIFNLLDAEWKSIQETYRVKNQVVNQLQNNMLSWVQGKGAGAGQRFITNWEKYLVDAYTANAAAGIDDVVTTIFGPIQASVQQTLVDAYTNPQQPDNLLTGITITTQHVCDNGNPPVCFDVPIDFNNLDYVGDPITSWGISDAIVQDQNNLYGALLAASEKVNERADFSLLAAQDEAIANQGFLSQKICLGGPKTPSGPFDPTKPCENYRINTPGSTIGHALDNVLNSAIEEINNAQFIPTYVQSSWDNSKLNGLIKGGDNVGLLNLK